MKYKLFILIAAASILGTSSTALAANASFTKKTTNTTAISVKSVNYDYTGSDDDIEIDFSTKVNYKSNASVKVTDSTGKIYTSYIEDKDNDELDIDVTNLAANKKYTVTITGIKKSTAAKYGTLTLQFSIPKASTKLVKDVEYDREDKEVSFDFSSKVTYKNAKVVITNKANTKSYTATIIEKYNDELTVRVTGLTYGAQYDYKISGVTNKTTGNSDVLSGSFTAVDND